MGASRRCIPTLGNGFRLFRQVHRGTRNALWHHLQVLILISPRMAGSSRDDTSKGEWATGT